MSKFFKKFNSHDDYLNYNLTKENTPNVTKCKDGIHYNRKIKLPYDAELLYLESSGEQYINLDYYIYNNGLSGDIVMQRLDDNTDERAYVGRTHQGGFDLYTGGYGRIALWFDGNSGLHEISSPNTNIIDKEIHHVLFDMNENGTVYLKVDNDEYSTNVTWNDNNSKSQIQLFSHRGYYNSTGRIYSCKLWDNGVMIYDLIPVRKDGVGYMYDKLSNQLYGNSANGAPLILGPDIN